MIFRRRYLGDFKKSEAEAQTPIKGACFGGPQRAVDDFWRNNIDTIKAAMDPSNSRVSPSQWMSTLAADAVFAQNLSDDPFKLLHDTYIKDFFQGEYDAFCAAAQACPDGAPFVKLFIESWNAYYRKATILSHLLSKCDARLAGIRANHSYSYMPIQPAARRMWSTSAEKSGIPQRVSQALCKMIKDEREGTVAPSPAQDDLIKRCIDALVAIGVDEGDPVNAVSKSIYVSWFENKFLEETTRFFAEEVLSYAPKGLKCMVELMYSRVVSEEARLALYLQRDPTEKRLYRMFNKIFVMEYKDIITKYFEESLKICDEEGMGQSYSLLSRVHGYVEPLLPMMQAKIERDGLAATNFTTPRSDISSPEFYVLAVVGIYDKYERIINCRLGKNENIHAVLTVACTKFANENVFLRTLASSAPSGTTQKSIAAQCVASYVDTVLKKGSAKSTPDSGIDASVTSFGLLEDKDAFMLYHAHKLSNRLLNGLSTSIDDEKSFLARIKESSNFNESEVKKMEDMIHDIEQSAALQPLFSKYCDEVASRDASSIALSTGTLFMRVLNKLNWSISINPVDQNFRIPCDSLRRTLSAYETFYLEQNKNTRFFHVHSQSRAEIEFRNGSNHYRMMTSAYQAAILLLFSNSASELTLGDIATQLCVPNVSSLMLPILGITKTKILQTGVAPVSWDSNTVFKFNPKFMSKKSKFALPQEKTLSLSKASLSSSTSSRAALTSQSAGDDDANEGTPSTKELDDRKVSYIEAAVVRIMKGKRILSYKVLHDEVAIALKNWFVMPTKLFKTAVEKLVDDEFLKRSTETGNVIFEYIP